jgi:hypothetical protein
MALHPRQSIFTLFFNQNQFNFNGNPRAVFELNLPTAINLPFRENWSMGVKSFSVDRQFVNFAGNQFVFLYKTPDSDWRGALLKSFSAHQPEAFASYFTFNLPPELDRKVALAYNRNTELLQFQIAQGYEVQLDYALQKVMGFHELQNPLGTGVTTAILCPSLTEGRNVLSLVTEHIAPPVASEGCFTLRELPLPPDPKGNLSYASWTFEKPLFLPLLGSRISKIVFSLVDELGDPLIFENYPPPSQLSLALTFRRDPFLL